MGKPHHILQKMAPAADKKKVVVQYFDAIGELHFFWRRAALKHLTIKKGYRILDLCGGAGEFA